MNVKKVTLYLRSFVTARKFLLLIAISIAIIVTTVALRTKDEEIQTSRITSQPSPDERGSSLTPGYPIDEVRNGIYTNHKYGFRFEYPQEIFITFDNHQSENNKLEKSNYFVEFKDVTGDGYPIKNYNLRVYAGYGGIPIGHPAGFGSTFGDYYKRPIGVPLFESQGDASQTHNELKIKNIKNDKFTGYVFYDYQTESLLNEGTEASVSYIADIAKGDLFITFIISSPVSANRDTLKQVRLELLEKLIDSLEFY